LKFAHPATLLRISLILSRSYGSEFQYGRFSRTISLPVAIEQDQAEADYTNGILTLRLPKVEQAANQKVKIHLDNQSQQAIAGSSD